MAIYGDGKQTRSWTHVDTVVETLAEMTSVDWSASHHLIQSRDVYTNQQIALQIRDHVHNEYGKCSCLEYTEDRIGNFSRGMLNGNGDACCWPEQRSLSQELAGIVDWYVAHGSWLKDCEPDRRLMTDAASVELGA